jgi:hypothetical protein
MDLGCLDESLTHLWMCGVKNSDPGVGFGWGELEAERPPAAKAEKAAAAAVPWARGARF